MIDSASLEPVGPDSIAYVPPSEEVAEHMPAYKKLMLARCNEPVTMDFFLDNVQPNIAWPWVQIIHVDSEHGRFYVRDHKQAKYFWRYADQIRKSS